MKKRILAMILCLLMVISLLPAGVFAAGASISVGSAAGKPGDTVTIPVSISGNPGFAGFTLTITAADGLALKEIKKGAKLAEAEGMFTANVAKNSVNWTGSANVEGDGELLLLTFDVSAEAAGGDYTVSIALKDGKTTNFANADETAVDVSFTAGAVTVEAPEPAGPKVIVGAATGKAGDTVSVPVTISENPGFAGFTLTITAADGLTLKEIKKGAKLADAEGMFTANVAKNSVNWTGSANVEGDGEILVLVFEIGADLADGDYAVSIALKDGKATNFANADETAVAVSFKAGAVTVTTEVPTEPTTAPTEPTTAPTEPTTKPTEPTTAPTEPTTAPTEPTEADKPCDGGKDCPSKNFKDVNYGDWYHEAVDFAVERGLFNGMSPTAFEPNTAMSRAMLVTVLWRYEGSLLEGTNTFTDVKAGQWYTEAVAWAAKNDIVNGVGNNKFDPNGKITREQMAAILYRYSDSKGYDTSARGSYAGFPDAAKISSWASDAYSWAVGKGLITGNVIAGKTLLDPQGNATRAQVATILMRYIKGLKDETPYDPQGHTYEFVRGMYSWEDAKKAAADKGGYLVRFDDAGEYKYVTREALKKGYQETRFIIGARRADESKDYFFVDAEDKPLGEKLNTAKSWTAELWLSGEPTYEWEGTQEWILSVEYKSDLSKWVLNDLPDNSDYPADPNCHGFIIEYEPKA